MPTTVTLSSYEHTIEAFNSLRKDEVMRKYVKYIHLDFNMYQPVESLERFRMIAHVPRHESKVDLKTAFPISPEGTRKLGFVLKPTPDHEHPTGEPKRALIPKTEEEWQKAFAKYTRVVKDQPEMFERMMKSLYDGIPDFPYLTDVKYVGDYPALRNEMPFIHAFSIVEWESTNGGKMRFGPNPKYNFSVQEKSFDRIMEASFLAGASVSRFDLPQRPHVLDVARCLPTHASAPEGEVYFTRNYRKMSLAVNIKKRVHKEALQLAFSLVTDELPKEHRPRPTLTISNYDLDDLGRDQLDEIFPPKCHPLPCIQKLHLPNITTTAKTLNNLLAKLSGTLAWLRLEQIKCLEWDQDKPYDASQMCEKEYDTVLNTLRSLDLQHLTLRRIQGFDRDLWSRRTTMADKRTLAALRRETTNLCCQIGDYVGRRSPDNPLVGNAWTRNRELQDPDYPWEHPYERLEYRFYDY